MSGDTVNFIASVDGTPITSERYTIGNGTRRSAVAKKWSKDARLRNGKLLRSQDIAARLEVLELEAQQILDEPDKEDRQRPVERASLVTENALIELAWNFESGGPDFIVYDRTNYNVSRAEKIDTACNSVRTPRMVEGIMTPGPGVEGSVLLPTECDEAAIDASQIRVDIASFINKYVELPGAAISIAIEYVLLTWVHDAFSELPYLTFRTSDIGRGKSRALEAVGSICYRPLFIGGGSSSAAMLRMLDAFGGTLVADEFDQHANTELGEALNKILNQGFQRNRPLVKCEGDGNTPRAFKCYGPKLFALRKRLGDDACESRTIDIRMKQRTRDDIPLNLPRDQFDREALELRNRLLAWRFRSFGSVRIDPTLADDRLEDRMNQIALPLLSVTKSSGTRSKIVRALLEQQTAIAADRMDSLPGQVFEVALAIGRPGGIVRPGEITMTLNRRCAEAQGVDVDKLKNVVRSEQVGRILSRDLELPRLKRDMEGARYRLDPVRVEQLKQRFELPDVGSDDGSSAEPSCEEMRC